MARHGYTPMAGPDDPRHGTVDGYRNVGCRCDLCREAWRDHYRAYLDADPARRERQRERNRRNRTPRSDRWEPL